MALGRGLPCCAPGDRAMARRLAVLSLSELGKLRGELQKLLEPTLRAATKRESAFLGPVNRQRVLEILSGEVWAGKLVWSAKQLQRTLRDQNVDSLTARHLLALVHGDHGFFQRLNPGEVPVELVASAGPRVQKAGPIEQRYALLEAGVALARVGYSDAEVRAFAEHSAALFAGEGDPLRQAQEALRHFLGQAQLRVNHRQRHALELARPPGMTPAEARLAAERLSRVRWIEAHVPGGPGSLVPIYRDDLAALFRAGTKEEVLEELDRRFELAMEQALGGERSSALAFLQTVRFDRAPADVARPDAEPRIEAETLPADHPSYRHLADLRARIEAGEGSAIGGADYGTQTFPEDLLRQVARGNVTVVSYDGSPAEALEYVRDRYDRDPQGHRSEARLMGLQGLYGSYPRQLVTLADGRHFLILAGHGRSRQLNNAASLLWISDEAGHRLPKEQLVLASSTRDLKGRLKEDLQAALQTDFARRPEIFGRPLGRIDEIPTRLLIVQNPAHFERCYPGRFVLGADPGPTSVPFKIGYLQLDSGAVERVIIPKVGGGGLYGDSAGAFVTAFFELGLERLVPEVIFSGTAGGFAGSPGLVGIEPGGIIVPQEGILAWGQDQLLPMASLFPRRVEDWPEALRVAFQRSGARASGRHVAVPAPALETYPMMRALADVGFGSVDVEGWSILEAVHHLRASRPEVTFTPVYHHSDDPRASEEDRYQSLAMTGPLFEGSKYPAELYGLIRALVEWSGALRGRGL